MNCPFCFKHVQWVNICGPIYAPYHFCKEAPAIFPVYANETDWRGRAREAEAKRITKSN